MAGVGDTPEMASSLSAFLETRMCCWYFVDGFSMRTLVKNKNIFAAINNLINHGFCTFFGMSNFETHSFAAHGISWNQHVSTHLY